MNYCHDIDIIHTAYLSKAAEGLIVFIFVHKRNYIDNIPVWDLGAVSIRKTVLPGMAIPMLKIRRPNGCLIFNMEITIRR